LTPYRVVASSYRYVKRGFQYDNWRWYSYPFKRLIQRTIHPPREVSGYALTSKPRYQVGDTLKVSAYLAKPKGRPLMADSIIMRIKRYSPYQQVMKRKIGRTEKGRYGFDMVIPADWQLDEDYYISFDLPGIFRRDIATTITFKLEDYELKEYKLSAEASEDTRLPGGAFLDVKATDINGLAIANGNIRLDLLLLRYGTTAGETVVQLPDTLYTINVGTAQQSDHRIVLPDSLFPTGQSLVCRAEIRLSGPSGEYKQVQKSITVDRRFPTFPEIVLRRDSIRFSRRGVGSASSATLEIIDTQKDTQRVAIELPHQIPLDHTQSEYRLMYGEQAASQPLRQLRPYDDNEQLLEWSPDTLGVYFSNPHRLPLNWQLVRNGEILGYGSDTGAILAWPDGPVGTKIDLNYHYFAGGQWHFDQFTTTIPDLTDQTDHPKKLALELDQPERVVPGSTVRMSVKATDQKGKGAKNVRLSAASYNAKFSEEPFTTPTYPTKVKRTKREQSFQLESANYSTNQTPPKWMIQQLKLDTCLAYQLRYFQDSFVYHQDLDTILPPGSYRAHFAPFVVRDHQVQRVRMVYVDDRLVYAWHPHITTPYSIPIDSGPHKISLRTERALFTKTMFFPARQQKVFSFDAERWNAAGWQYQKRDRKLSEQEEKYLNNRLFSVNKMNPKLHYRFRTRGEMIQSGEGYGSRFWIALGLATPGDSIDFWWPEGDSTSFIFEPGVTYRIHADRERLYPLEDQFQFYPYGRKRIMLPGIPQYTIKKDSAGQQLAFTMARELPRLRPKEACSRLQLQGIPSTVRQVLLRHVGKNMTPQKVDTASCPERLCYFEVQKNDVNTVPPGQYEAYFLFSPDSVLYRSFKLAENTITLLHFAHDSLSRLTDDAIKTRGIFSRRHPRLQRYEEDIFYDFGPGARTVSGTVTDEEGEPLIGVSILIKGTTVGTVTDLEGKFSIKAPLNAELVISYTGFTSQRVRVGRVQQRQLNVALAEHAMALEEVV
ncbi:MAG: carboxypeptidase-like regulatory domain-containing protein, partial [Bacteroidota bacterium]